MEALTHGLPIVSCGGPGTSDLVHTGINGLLYDPGSAADLARQIEQVLADSPRGDMVGKKKQEKLDLTNPNLRSLQEPEERASESHRMFRSNQHTTCRVVATPADTLSTATA